MNLTPEQKAAVSSWIAAGDNLSAVQKKLREQFQVSLTYMDVRFLVDDLNLTLKDATPKADVSDVTKAKLPPSAPPARPAAAAPEKKGLLDKAKEKLGLGGKPGAADAAGDDADLPAEDAGELGEDDAFPPAPGNVAVDVDAVTLLPGAIASGTVTFSDGVTGKWIVDHQGRPGFTEISQPGYRPSREDAQAFMQQLDEALRQKGF